MQLSIPRNITNTNKKTKTYNYIKYIDSYRNQIYLHSSIVLIHMILYYIIVSSLSVLLYWINIITTLVSSIFIVMLSIYLYILISSWNISINNNLIRFWDLCTQISIKNYRLLREYKEVYDYHYSDIKKKITDNKTNIKKDIESYVTYVLDNDASERMDSYEWVENLIYKICNYIKISYYLSFIRPSDKIELINNDIRINIKTDYVLNKRNRKLEETINNIPREYKIELLKAWSLTDRNESNGFLTIIPCKWITYEYRNLYRYLHCAKYFKYIYSGFDKDYAEIENIVGEICQILNNIFRRDTVYIPISFIKAIEVISDMFMYTIDNFIAINLLSNIYNTGSLIVPLFFSIIFHIMLVCIKNILTDMINQIKNPLDTSDNLLNIDQRIETIFTEMNAIITNGKNRY